jgi:hypothetical protein
MSDQTQRALPTVLNPFLQESDNDVESQVSPTRRGSDTTRQTPHMIDGGGVFNSEGSRR